MTIFQFSKVQTYTARYFLKQLSTQTDYTISIDKVKIAWLDRGELLDFLVMDKHGDTLIAGDRVTVNYKLVDLFEGDYFSLEEVLLEKTKLNVVKYEGEEDLNISQFIRSFKREATQSNSGNKTKVSISHIESNDLVVRVDDRTKADFTGQVDFSNLDLSIPNLNLFDFALKADTISGNLDHFTTFDQLSNLEISQFQTEFELSKHSLSLDNLKLKTPTSQVSDSLVFFYNGFDDFSHFTDSVSFVFHFSETIISKEDIQLFSRVDVLKSSITLDGVFWGKVGDFNIEDSRIGFGKSSFLKGGVSCFGLPDISKTFILSDITNSHLDPVDLIPYIGTFSENLIRMGRIDFYGSFAGFVKDFVAKGDFYTNQGSVHSDINIKIPDAIEHMSYSGNLEFENVNIGTFFENDIVQNVNLKTNIEGQGITANTANFLVDTKIYNSEFKGYMYDFIEIHGSFAKNFFDGNFLVKDPNCRIRGDAKVDISPSVERISFNLKADSISLHKLNFSTDFTQAKGNIKMDLVGFDFDTFNGRLNMDSVQLDIRNRQLVLNDIAFVASYSADSIREVYLKMPGLKAKIDGRFKIMDIIKDIPIMVKGYLNKLHLARADIRAKEARSAARYKLDFNVDIEDISAYLDSLRLPLKIFSNASLETSFRQGSSRHLSVFFNADSVKYAKTTFHNPTLDINGSLRDGEEGMLTSFLITSDTQEVEGMPQTNDLLIEGIWFKNLIEMTLAIQQQESKSNISLESGITLSSDSIIVRILPSDLYLLDDTWKFNPSNQLVITENDILINNFEIFNSSESIYVGGKVSDSSETLISIQVEDLKMNKANLFTQSNFDGYLSGKFEVFRTTTQEPLKSEGGFFLKNLSYDQILIGDLTGNTSWNADASSFFTELSVSMKDVESIDISGYYYPLNVDDQLDFVAKFNKVGLDIIQPFLRGSFSNVQGSSDGEIAIKGTFSEPVVEGRISLENTHSRIEYLNTSYNLNGDILIYPTQVAFENLVLEDRKGNKSVLSGGINHDSFTNLRTDVKLSAYNFEFLNTTNLDNEHYYGSAYGTGNIHITGPFNDMSIKANLVTEPGTRFFIPISESEEGTQKDFIEFVNFKDTAILNRKEQDFTFQGLTLDLDLDITPDAYCELIYNIKKGDIIRGRGKGSLKMILDTDGEFNMFGGIELTKGDYNFTAVVNKEFDVVPGGKITWYGDPYNATLEMEATYLQRASTQELLKPDERDKSLMARKIPFLAVIDLSGTMLNLKPKFNIRPQNEGEMSRDDTQLLNQVLNDEQELGRQFVSLLFLKKFSTIAGFFSGGSNNISGSVSEILSNQISYIFSQIDENLEVELDLVDFSEAEFNTFQLRLAYTFLEGRLRVSSGRNFGKINQPDQNTIHGIIGDWSVEYSLTKDGRLRIKAFTNSNELISSNGQSFETGASVKFIDSFDRIKDILRLSRAATLLRKEDGENKRKNISDKAELPPIEK